MAGHHPFSELRAKLLADAERAALLAAAEQEVAAEQAAYDRVLADVRRARAYTMEQFARTLGLPHAEVAQIERHADLYLSTLHSYLAAMGGALEVAARFGDTPYLFSLDDLIQGDEIPAIGADSSPSVADAPQAPRSAGIA